MHMGLDIDFSNLKIKQEKSGDMNLGGWNIVLSKVLFKLCQINVIKANKIILLLKNLGVTMPPAPNVACPGRKLLQIPVIVRYLTILFGDLGFRNLLRLQQKERDLVMCS